MTDNNTEARDFKAVIDQWTEACLKENSDSKNPSTTLSILRLGTLGQRLIYEANALGLDAALQALREKA